MITKILLNPKVIIGSYVIVSLAKIFYSSITSQDSLKMLLVRGVSGLIIILLSWFSIKNNRMCSILLAIIIAISGIATLGISFLVSFEQPVIKTLFILIGVYWAYGGIKLFLEKPEKVEKL